MIHQWILGFSLVQTTRQARSWSPTVCICNESNTCQHHDWVDPHYTPWYSTYHVCIVNIHISSKISWNVIIKKLSSSWIFRGLPWSSITFHSLPGVRTVQRRSAQLLNGFRQVTWFFMRINSYEWVWLMVMNDGYWWLWTMVWLLIMVIHGYQRLFIAIHSQSCFLMVIVRDEGWFINGN